MTLKKDCFWQLWKFNNSCVFTERQLAKLKTENDFQLHQICKLNFWMFFLCLKSSCAEVLYKKKYSWTFCKACREAIVPKFSFNTVLLQVKKHFKTVGCDVLLVFMVKTLHKLLTSIHHELIFFKNLYHKSSTTLVSLALTICGDLNGDFLVNT